MICFSFFLGGWGGGDMMKLWAFWGAIAKLDYFWELFLNLRFRYRIGIFLGVANFQLFWGMSDTSDPFLEWGNAWSKST